jgi:hypothetical protein
MFYSTIVIYPWIVTGEFPHLHIRCNRLREDDLHKDATCSNLWVPSCSALYTGGASRLTTNSCLLGYPRLRRFSQHLLTMVQHVSTCT